MYVITGRFVLKILRDKSWFQSSRDYILSLNLALHLSTSLLISLPLKCPKICFLAKILDSCGNVACGHILPGNTPLKELGMFYNFCGALSMHADSIIELWNLLYSSEKCLKEPYFIVSSERCQHWRRNTPSIRHLENVSSFCTLDSEFRVLAIDSWMMFGTGYHNYENTNLPWLPLHGDHVIFICTQRAIMWFGEISSD